MTENTIITKSSYTAAPRNTSWVNPFTWTGRWTSEEALAAAEHNILASIWDSIEEKFVTVADGTMKLRTIALNTESDATPMVLVHGLGGGVGLWLLNLQALSKNRPVYAFDVLGFGRSSRPTFSTDAKLAELEFVLALEDWRKAMGLENFILLGHSLGAYISASYAMRYANKVNHLILADPWGFPERPKNPRQVRVSLLFRILRPILTRLNPFASIRAAGPWASALVKKFRPGLLKPYEHLCDKDVVCTYVVHCNTQKPSGEVAYKTMEMPVGWAKFPMAKRMVELPQSMPITFLHGSESWFDHTVCEDIKQLRKDSYVDVKVVHGSGHLLFAEGADEFNNLVNEACQDVENYTNSHTTDERT